MILDDPFVLEHGPGPGKWKPSNYSKEFYGPTPMRVGLEKSRNLMTVRLAQTVGMAKVADYARRFGVVANLDPVLSMALGAGETTLRSEEHTSALQSLMRISIAVFCVKKKI